jgi:hypothetical protein
LGMRAMAQTVCAIINTAERERLAAIAADRNRARKHVDRARIVLASAAGGAKHRRQPANGVAMAAALCRSGGRRSVAR